jgi:hypothetical protein
MATRKSRPYRKKRRYKIVKVEEEIHKNLLRLQSYRQLKTGQKVTLNQLIKEWLETQPTFRVSAEEI